MKKDLKSNVLVNFLWKLGERVGSQLVTFIVSIVLAWYIDPDGYAVVTIVTIMVTLCNLFVVSGFGNSLVQKKNADNIDFSSVFYFSIGFSLTVYAILFFAAPYIESFFDIPFLCPVIRVMGIRIVISAVSSVQEAYVAKKMEFKRFFFSTLGGTLVSGAAGVLFAMFLPEDKRFWAVVAQYLINTVVNTLVLWFTVKWRPSLAFSWTRLRGLLSFGWKVLVGAMIEEIYNNMRFFIIGKTDPSKKQLSLYNNGQRIPNMLVDNINSSLFVVMFPAFSKHQDSLESVKAMTRRSIKVCLFIMMPLMAGLAVCASPIVHILLPESWHECIPFIQLSALSFATIALQTANTQAIKAIGRSDVTLKCELIKRAVGFAILFGVMSYGAVAIAASVAVTSVIFALINTVPNKLYLKYRYREQLSDVIPVTLITVIMSVCVWFVGLLPFGAPLVLTLQVIVGASVYLALAWILKLDSLHFLLGFLKDFRKGKNEE